MSCFVVDFLNVENVCNRKIAEIKCLLIKQSTHLFIECPYLGIRQNVKNNTTVPLIS